MTAGRSPVLAAIAGCRPSADLTEDRSVIAGGPVRAASQRIPRRREAQAIITSAAPSLRKALQYARRRGLPKLAGPREDFLAGVMGASAQASGFISFVASCSVAVLTAPRPPSCQAQRSGRKHRWIRSLRAARRAACRGTKSRAGTQRAGGARRAGLVRGPPGSGPAMPAAPPMTAGARWVTRWLR